ncbi:MAG: hypothetical protein Q8L26_03560 [Candidatus Omnitrophota bacterium]|nr:hypothetical protein [Candidatus Omnitrophota bacterium]
MRNNRRAMSIMEYALLIAATVAACTVMFRYLSFSVQGKLRQGADVFGSGEQYETGVTVVQ